MKYLLDQLDTTKTFSSIAEVKATSILTSNGKAHSPSDGFTYLSIGENVVAMGLANLGYDVYTSDGLDVDWPGAKRLTETPEELVAQHMQFDYVIAADEYLVNCATEQEQLDKIATISKLTRKGFYTTLKDYKNMNQRDRIFFEPFELHTDNGDFIVIHKRDWDRQDRQHWTDRVWVIHNDELVTMPTSECRTMYFKQLAKFSHDAGAKEFLVEKKLMYKPLFSKAFEYIVYISF